MRRHNGFTLIELFVVVVAFAMFATLAVSVLAGARTNTKAAQCLNNLRRLTVAWQMYSSDNADRMISNPIWVAGLMDWGVSPDNTNSAKLIDPIQSPIARYVQATDLFKCPADNYVSPNQSSHRVRSVALNAALGRSPTIIQQIPGRTYFEARKITELNKPGPSSTLVIFDEHPDSIDDGVFFADIGLAAPAASWRNLPASYHGGAGGLSFADGGAMLKRWQDVRTVQSVRFIGFGMLNVPGSVDYTWVNDRMPYR